MMNNLVVVVSGLEVGGTAGKFFGGKRLILDKNLRFVKAWRLLVCSQN